MPAVGFNFGLGLGLGFVLGSRIRQAWVRRRNRVRNTARARVRATARVRLHSAVGAACCAPALPPRSSATSDSIAPARAMRA